MLVIVEYQSGDWITPPIILNGVRQCVSNRRASLMVTFWCQIELLSLSVLKHPGRKGLLLYLNVCVCLQQTPIQCRKVGSCNFISNKMLVI